MLRNTPLFWPLGAFGLGLAMPLILPLPYYWVVWMGSVLGIFLLYGWIRTFSLILFFGCCGTLRKPIPPAPPSLSPSMVITCGVYPEETAKSWRIIADIVSGYSSDTLGWAPSSGKILLYIDKRALVEVKPGQYYVIRGKGRQITGPERPTDFDFQSYMIRKGVFHQMWVPSNQIKVLSASPNMTIKVWLLARARKVGQIFHHYIDPKDAADVTEAMITGRRDHLSDELSQQYTAAGAVHVLAVSGMHISLVYGLLTLLFRGQILIWPRAWIKPKLVISLFILTVYAGFTGMSASVMRATVMFYLVIVGQWFQRHVSSENTLYGTSLILIYIEPAWLYDIGFQLSFCAVWGILTLYPRCRLWWKPENPIVRWMWELTALGLSAQLFTFPITLFYFHQFPTYFYVTNLVTALLASALVPLGLALWGISNGPFTFLTNSVAKLTGGCAQGLNFLNSEIASLPYSVVRGYSLDPWEVVLWYALLAIVLWGYQFLPRKWILWIVMVGIYCMWGNALRKDIVQEKRNRVEVWDVARQTAWIKIQGKRALCISREPISESTKKFSFANYWAKEGVCEVHYLSGIENSVE